VVYIFSNTDPEYFNNLKFFLKWGVREGDGAYYIIVVQEGGKSPVSPYLALTPVNCFAALALNYTYCGPSDASARRVPRELFPLEDTADSMASVRPLQHPRVFSKNTGRPWAKRLASRHLRPLQES
jgi:hypothetical protein